MRWEGGIQSEYTEEKGVYRVSIQRRREYTE